MPPKKEEPKPNNLLPEVLGLLVAIFFIYMVILRVQAYLAYYHEGTFESLWGNFTAYILLHIWPMVKIVGTLVVIMAAFGITYLVRKLHKLAGEERALYSSHTSSESKDNAPSVKKNEKWERVMTHINSSNQSDWRLAIIEADIILDELLRARGYQGDTIGDMLKGVDRPDLRTIDAAWEAHKVRNQVAHAGADFELSERDAKRVISLYESVFKESSVI